MPGEYYRSETMYGMANPPMTIIILPTWTIRDQTSKLIDSSANRGLVIAYEFAGDQGLHTTIWK